MAARVEIVDGDGDDDDDEDEGDGDGDGDGDGFFLLLPPLVMRPNVVFAWHVVYTAFISRLPLLLLPPRTTRQPPTNVPAEMRGA